MSVQSAKRSAKPDLVISCVLLVVCTGAMLWSFTYPTAVSMLLPRLAAGLGLLCAAWMIVGKWSALSQERIRLLSGPLEGEDVFGAQSAASHGDGKEQDPNDPEYILSHASRRAWLTALGFISAFFLVLYLCGIFVAAAALSLSYLTVIGKKSWRFSSIYTVVLTGLLWLLMRQVTYIPSPVGILFSGG
jgi:hypothetical protein